MTLEQQNVINKAVLWDAAHIAFNRGSQDFEKEQRARIELQKATIELSQAVAEMKPGKNQ